MMLTAPTTTAASATLMSGGTRLVIRGQEGCTDPGLNGASLWSREVIPMLVPPNGTEAEVAAALQTAPTYSTVIIGRRPNCFIVLCDPSISGHHCQLTVTRPPLVKRSPSMERQQQQQGSGDDASGCPTPKVFITDSSTNGTYVDGRRLRRNHPTPLQSNSLVSLGRCSSEAGTFSFRVALEVTGSSAPVDLASGEMLASAGDDEDESAARENQARGAGGAAQRTTTLTSRLATARGEDKSPSGRKHSTPPRNRWVGGCSTTQSTMSGSGFVAVDAPVSASRTSGSSRLAEVIKRLQEENAKKDDEIAEIAEELDCAESARDLLREENEALQRQVAHLSDQVATAEAAAEEAKALAAEQSNRCAALASQIDRLQASRASATAEANREAERWRERAAEWEAQSVSTSRRLEAAQLQLQEAYQDRQALRNRVTELAAQLEEAEHRRRQAAMAVDAAKAETAAVTRAAEAAACDAAAKEDRLDKQLKQVLSKLKGAEQAHSKAAEDSNALRRETAALVAKHRELEELVEVQAADLRKVTEAAQTHREALEKNRRLSVTLSELARQTYAMARSLSEEKLPPHYDVNKTPPTTRMKAAHDTDAAAAAVKGVKGGAGTLFQKTALLSRCCESSPNVAFFEDDEQVDSTWPLERTPPLRPANKRYHDGLWTDDEDREEATEPAVKRCREEEIEKPDDQNARNSCDVTPLNPTPVHNDGRTRRASGDSAALLGQAANSEPRHQEEPRDVRRPESEGTNVTLVNDKLPSGGHNNNRSNSTSDSTADEEENCGENRSINEDTEALDLDAVLAPADFDDSDREPAQTHSKETSNGIA